MTDDSDDAVGYRKPPKRTRFKKGQSGNPDGRPKRVKGNLYYELARMFGEKIIAEENGEKIEITKAQALGKRILAKALNGDIQTIKLIGSMMPEILKAQEKITGASPDHIRITFLTRPATEENQKTYKQEEQDRKNYTQGSETS